MSHKERLPILPSIGLVIKVLNTKKLLKNKNRL